MHQDGDWMSARAIQHAQLTKLKRAFPVWNALAGSSRFLQQIQRTCGLRITGGSPLEPAAQ